MSTPTVVVMGSSNVDLVVHVPHLPLPGETILGDDVVRVAGGKGANQAVAAQRAGAVVAFVGCLGDDAFADLALSEMTGAGVDLSHARRVPGTVTGLAFITVTEDSENSIVVSPGANAALGATEVTAAQALIAGAHVVVTQLEIPLATVTHALTLARNAGTTTLLNAAQSLAPDLLALVDVLVCNETEATTLTQMPVTDAASAQAAAHHLRGQGPHTVIITLGAQGALVVTRDGVQHQPAFDVTVVDTTAAGDAFTGALAAQLAGDVPIMPATRFAGAAGALTVTQAGAQSSLPMRPAIDTFLANSGSCSP